LPKPALYSNDVELRCDELSRWVLRWGPFGWGGLHGNEMPMLSWEAVVEYLSQRSR
jgi:hypothetical protein